jgi:nicotinate-nucleotide adenylyltransferase
VNPVGILGGTFDPIHYGHLRMAQELYEALKLVGVRFIPAACPPHREPPQSPAEDRVAMVRLAIAGNPAFSLDVRELQRPGASYSFDTLAQLRAELGEQTPLCLLIGADAFLGLATWHRWSELLGLVHIVVAHRPGATPSEASMPPLLRAQWRRCSTLDIASLHNAASGKILLQRVTALDISATAIRASLRRDCNTRYLLPYTVNDYIQTHRLYKEPHAT